MNDSKDLGPENHSVELTLPNELGYERLAMACSATLAKIHGFPDARIEDLKTVVAEATTNAMLHGNRNRPGSRVTVRVEVTSEAIHVAVTDEGPGIKGALPEPDIERVIAKMAPPVGFGIFLMRNLADRIEFRRRSGGGHVVRMVIRMKPGAGESIDDTATAAI